ncbi:MAG: glucuronate isomerase [Candidatus Spyradocola sp.]|jgi:glucuronate isomerase
MAFLDEDFLLKTPAARILYHDYAADMPILDYHCHLSPQEIYENRSFSNIAQVWLGGDHYKWRLLRAGGVEEAYITGNASDREKFQKYAEVLSRSIGNPLYHWSHLELKRYFGFDGVLGPDTAQEVWDLCEEKLQGEDMRARALIEKSNVKLVCTTDDPADDLKFHRLLADDASFSVRVLPAWRPDKAVAIEKPDFAAYIARLGQAAGREISSFADLMDALRARMDFFHENGCRLSDHGLLRMVYHPLPEAEVEAAFAARLRGETLSPTQEDGYKTALLLFLGREYARRDWAMQLHYGVKRDNNRAMYEAIGPDTGFDAIENVTPSAALADFLDALERTDELPRTLVYSLNPSDDDAIDAILGCFQKGPTVSKMQHGSAWWFNDQKQGMEKQLTSLANKGYLAGFVGMLTDSRSFLSYPRHEYFRRVLCNLLGSWIEEGEYPADLALWGSVVQDISYNNAAAYFHFPA